MFNNTKDSVLSKTRQIKFSLAFVLFILGSFNMHSQCAMCRASLASEGNKTKAEAVNDGIVYLMVIPYLLVGGIGYAIYRMKKK